MLSSYSPPVSSTLAMPVWITHGSRVSLGLQGLSMTGASDASTAWGVANDAIFYPFEADGPFWVRRIGWLNGTVVAGNVDVALYSTAFARLLAAGSTAQAGTSVIQVVDVTDTKFPAGRYYIGVAASDATATFMATPLTTAIDGRWAGCAQESSALPLPATATPVTFAKTFIPYAGLCQRDTA